jgi:hypothetical protein
MGEMTKYMLLVQELLVSFADTLNPEAITEFARDFVS